MADFDTILNGAVFRAAICQRCGYTTAIAVDDEASFKWIRVKHPRGAKRNPWLHEVLYNCGKMLTWRIGIDGKLSSSSLEKDAIIRVSPNPLPPSGL